MGTTTFYQPALQAKLKRTAVILRRHSTIGEDTVAH